MLDRLLSRDPRVEGIPCDVYDVSGRNDFAWNGTAYYPPRLSAMILSRSVMEQSGALVPCVEDHFRSLAFHAVYHKGHSSGLAVRVGAKPRIAHPDHDYAGTLQDLAYGLNVAVEISLSGLDLHLASVGWRPALDNLAKWSRRNSWLEELLADLTRDLKAPSGLAVFIIRQQASASKPVRHIEQIIDAHGFDRLASVELQAEQMLAGEEGIRGGNWGAGPYPISGGGPAVAVIAIDPMPTTPNAEDSRKHPTLDNSRLLGIKNEVREWWNSTVQPHQRCNVLHSSDSAVQAVEYLETIGIRVDDLL